jgi:hypothetical protein
VLLAQQALITLGVAEHHPARETETTISRKEGQPYPSNPERGFKAVETALRVSLSGLKTLSFSLTE